MTFLVEIRNVLFFETRTIFWFLEVLIIFGIVIYFLKDKKQLNIVFLISFIFFLFGLYITTYRYLFIGTKWEIGITFFHKYYYTNRFPIFMLFLPLLGYYIRKYDIDNKLKLRQVIVFLLISWGLLILESYKFYDKSFTYGDYDFFLCTPIVASLLFLLLKKTDIKLNFNTKVLRSMSTSIYYCHYAFVYVYNFLIRNYRDLAVFQLTEIHSSLHFLFVLDLTIVFIIIVSIIKEIYIKLIKHSHWNAPPKEKNSTK